MTDFFIHYGVKGMKWGVRRGSSVRAKSSDSDDYKATKAARKTPNRQLSNAQLKKLNERLQLEKTNKDLTSAGSLRKIKAGTAAVTALVGVVTLGNSAIQAYNSPAGQAAIAAGKAALTTARVASGILANR